MIKEFMLKEHGKLFVLIVKLEKDSSNVENFLALKKGQEAHAYGEEKAIFIFDKEGKHDPVLIEVMQQHSEITKLLDKMDLMMKGEEDISKELKKLKTILKKHVKLEESKFYPKLDKDLTNQEKKEVISNFKEAVLGSISKGKSGEKIR